MWVGQPGKCVMAAERFRAALGSVENSLLTALPAGGHIDRLTWAQLSVADGLAHGLHDLGNGLLLLDGDAAERSGGAWPAGLLACSSIGALVDLATMLTASHQTLSLFGFTKDEIEQFLLRTRPMTIRRIVSIGASNRFSHIWDGYDLINEMTSKLVVDIRHSPSS
jgi:hypothetical protein